MQVEPMIETFDCNKLEMLASRSGLVLFFYFINKFIIIIIY